MNVMAVALTDPSTNIIQPSSFNKNSQSLRRNKSIPVIKTDSGPVSLFGQTPNIVVTRDRRASSGGPLSTMNGPQSLPVVRKSKHKKDNTEVSIMTSFYIKLIRRKIHEVFKKVKDFLCPTNFLEIAKKITS